MTRTHKTLVGEVQHIEQEAAELVSRAKELVKEKAAQLKQRMQESRESIEKKAAVTSEAILRERKESAQKEAQQITAQNRAVVAQVHASAEKNRSRALKKVKALFHSEYGTKL